MFHLGGFSYVYWSIKFSPQIGHSMSIFGSFLASFSNCSSSLSSSSLVSGKWLMSSFIIICILFSRCLGIYIIFMQGCCPLFTISFWLSHSAFRWDTALKCSLLLFVYHLLMSGIIALISSSVCQTIGNVILVAISSNDHYFS